MTNETQDMNDKNTEAAKTARAPIATDIAAVHRAVQDFGDLLTRETAALKNADFEAVDALQPEKRDFARRYHALITGLCERPEEMVTLDAETRDRLDAARRHFGGILQENLHALDAAKESARRLVNRILETARRSVVDDRQTHYSGSGRAQSYKTATLSLSIDQNL